MRKIEDLADIIKDMELSVTNLKTKQLTGSSNIVSYDNETDDTWDMDWTPISVGGGGYAQRTVTVTFTSATKPAAMTAIEGDFYYNGIRFTNENIPFMYQIFDSQESSDVEVAQYQYSADFIIQADTTSHIQLKFRAVSNDTGELDVSWTTDLGS